MILMMDICSAAGCAMHSTKALGRVPGSWPPLTATRHCLSTPCINCTVLCGRGSAWSPHGLRGHLLQMRALRRQGAGLPGPGMSTWRTLWHHTPLDTCGGGKTPKSWFPGRNRSVLWEHSWGFFLGLVVPPPGTVSPPHWRPPSKLCALK